MPVVNVSTKGQIVIPSEIRKRLDLKRGTKVEMVLRAGVVEIRRLARQVETDWRRWEGSLSGSGVLKQHEAEHAREIASGR
jgi:AbrB family looped-hinge helix DNA binding protein